MRFEQKKAERFGDITSAQSLRIYFMTKTQPGFRWEHTNLLAPVQVFLRFNYSSAVKNIKANS